jgi:hypothetical protein
MSTTQAEPATIEAILLLYGQLSDGSQEIVRERLLKLEMEVQQMASNAERTAHQGKQRIQ